jgi:hypothetical protein
MFDEDLVAQFVSVASPIPHLILIVRVEACRIKHKRLARFHVGCGFLIPEVAMY